jgi:GTP pyrophosphokinase
VAIQLASKQGDSIISVDYQPQADVIYPVDIQILAIDRLHLLSDMINCITQDLNLSIDALNTVTIDNIVNCTITFGVHSYGELQTIIEQIYSINGIEEIKITK